MKTMKIKLLTASLMLMTFNPFVETAYAETTNSIVTYQVSNPEIDNAVAHINSGCADFSDYEKIGIKFTCDDADIETLNEQINSYRNVMERDFSKDELIPIINSSLSYSKEVINRINSGAQCYQYDYYTVGINLELYQVDAVTSYCSQNDSSTVPKIKANTKTALEILKRINEGCASLDDYKNIGLDLSNVDIDIDILNKSVKKEKIRLAHELSKYELSLVIKNILN